MLKCIEKHEFKYGINCKAIAYQFCPQDKQLYKSNE
jgi:hypothetical protein